MLKVAWVALPFVVAVAGSVYASIGSVSLGIFEAQQDIGTSKTGTALFDLIANHYSVMSSGANIGAMNDEFHFVYSKLSGDVVFNADVHFAGGSHKTTSKAVLMVRQDLDPNAAFADVTLRGDGRTSLEYRPSKGVETSEFRAAMSAPSHVSITRHGHEFTIYAGNFGEETAMTGPIVVAMQDPVYIGLGVCAPSPNSMETATFSNVRLTKGSRK